MVKKQAVFILRRSFTMVLCGILLVLTGCSTDLSSVGAPGSNSDNTHYASLSINYSSSRSVYTAGITKAVITVNSSDIGSGSEPTATASVSGGAADNITVEKIPVGKNRIVTVQAYNDAAKINGVTIRAVTDIAAGNNSVTVNWDTTAAGNVYYDLAADGVAVAELTDAEEETIAAAIPSGVSAPLVDAASIASDYKAGSLGSSSSYKLTAATLTFTCYQADGFTAQVGDPSSTVVTGGTAGSEVTVTGIAPGTWPLYIVGSDGNVVTKKTLTFTSGTENTAGTLPYDGILVVTAKGSYPLIHYWSCSNAAAYPNTTWPGTKMTAAGNYYEYGFNGVSSVSCLVTNSGGTKLCNSDMVLSAKGVYIVTSSGASLIDGTTPADDSEPSVTISPSSSVSLDGNITVTLNDGNETITSAAVSAVCGTVTKSYTYSDFTSDVLTIPVSDLTTESGASISVSASAVNAEGTGRSSATITTTDSSDETLTGSFNQLRIYQIMVSSFQDGDSKIGFTTAYGPGGQLTGGDLQGVINALDYIKSLGMNAVWLTPIFNSNGDSQLDSTGYYTYDYFDIDPHFGTKTKLQELVKACHDRHMYIILDGVFGHWGASIKASPNGITPVRSNGQYNGCDYPASLAFFEEVASYWITNYQIDGWRLDQCYQAGVDGDNVHTGGHNYWYELRQTVENAAAQNRAAKKEWGTLGYMVGEDWESQANIQAHAIAPGTASGYGLRSCFDFPSRYSIVNSLAKAESDAGGNALGSSLAYVFETSSSKGYYHPDDYYPNLFFTNHDLVRFGNLINWKYGETPSDSDYWGRHRLALATLTAYTGPVTVYYGDEWGAYVDGYTGPGALGAYNDNAARSTGKISGFDTNQQSLHDYAAALMKARAGNEALWNGTSSTLSSSSSFYAGKKVKDSDTVVFMMNSGSSSVSYSVGSSGTDIVTGETTTSTVTVPAMSAVFIKLN